jgi:CheY-like chemotaxis protein
VTQSEPFSAYVSPAVLLVDAAEDEREMYATALSRQGYEIRQASTTAEALHEIKIRRPDAIVADVCLPMVGGLDLLRLVRHDQDTHDIPFVILSGYAGTLGEIAQATALGADAVRVKPLTADLLGTDLAQLIERSRKLRAASAEMRMQSAELRERAGSQIVRSQQGRARAGRAVARAAKFRNRTKS